MTLHPYRLFFIPLLCSHLYSQSITSSAFSNGFAVSSNESHECSSVVGETFVGTTSGQDYLLFVGCQFIASDVRTDVSRLDTEGLPKEFSLSQNYPNPFNPSTTIPYEIPKSTFVSLKIYNTLGQLVATLVDAEKEAGYHQVQWSPNVPSGVYFYRLHAGGFVDTRRMILLR
jgi:hypothetical protein